MKYTTYFAQLFKDQRVPQIEVDQLNNIMNIVPRRANKSLIGR